MAEAQLWPEPERERINLFHTQFSANQTKSHGKESSSAGASSTGAVHCTYCDSALDQSPHGGTNWCGNCRAAVYCNKQCQTADWRAGPGHPGHKCMCRLMALAKALPPANPDRSYVVQIKLCGKGRLSEWARLIAAGTDMGRAQVYHALAEGLGPRDRTLIALEARQHGLLDVRVVPASVPLSAAAVAEFALQAVVAPKDGLPLIHMTANKPHRPYAIWIPHDPVDAAGIARPMAPRVGRILAGCGLATCVYYQGGRGPSAESRLLAEAGLQAKAPPGGAGKSGMSRELLNQLLVNSLVEVDVDYHSEDDESDEHYSAEEDEHAEGLDEQQREERRKSREEQRRSRNEPRAVSYDADEAALYAAQNATYQTYDDDVHNDGEAGAVTYESASEDEDFGLRPRPANSSSGHARMDSGADDGGETGSDNECSDGGIVSPQRHSLDSAGGGHVSSGGGGGGGWGRVAAGRRVMVVGGMGVFGLAAEGTDEDPMLDTAVQALREAGAVVQVAMYDRQAGKRGQEELAQALGSGRFGAAWVHAGGLLLLNGERAAAGVAREWFGLRWRMEGDYYCRTEHGLNPGCALLGPLAARLPPALDVKACLLAYVPGEQRVYVSAPGALSRSHVPAMAGAPVGDLAAVTVAAVGSGAVGFLGDVNWEEASLQLMTALVGQLAKPPK
ncbi:hypothetical protein HYH03_009216 [Edaphochlamys debaryana]|uniref:MYND-type domain-containing protein n=1 Tax=Edaphochlamys debaryana TaxID=47281 RepID=A0A836BYQ1_9CHLO|nr:hypothetical protein HYH03_009216 [Edaphochlamys debaryana]|eukprot:KAG2492553.1 hypothetical protein HYH03_009216 [Edaphochlamys debaryana]